MKKYFPINKKDIYKDNVYPLSYVNVFINMSVPYTYIVYKV